MTIGWDQIRGGAPVVLYDTQDHGRRDWLYKYKQTNPIKTSKHGMNNRFIKLTHLEPDTKYFFVIRDNLGVSKRYWFLTAPNKQKAFTFIAGGDTKSRGESLLAGRASNRLAAKLFPLFVLFTGDFTSGAGTDAEAWKQWFRDWQALTTSKDGHMIPLIPVHGNHENADKTQLSLMFNTPFQGDDAKNTFYSLSFGGNLLHIIILNTEIDPGGMQRTWLAADLKKHQNFTFQIAAYHKPFWPHTLLKIENKNLYKQWADLFFQYRLCLSLDADSHLNKITFPLRPDNSKKSFMGFVRDDKNGTMYLNEGSWGAHPRPNNDLKPWTYTSGCFNQFKWIHVLPGSDVKEPKLKIHVVISGTYLPRGKIKHKLYDTEVETLTYKGRFKIPTNIKLQQFPNGKNYVCFPFSEGSKTSEK
jgi:hypothetical protein